MSSPDVDTRDDVRFAGELGTALLAEAPRVLGLMDRDPASRSAGCMDRTFWAWKFTDFASPRFQEGVCYLAFLGTRRIDGSPYVGNVALLEWIGLALEWWSRAQHRDGSFDEAYPWERSLAATAFSSFYVAEALDMLGEAVAPATLAKTRDSLARAGEWLLEADETHGFLSNHLAAAAAALYHVFRVTGDVRFERRSRHFRDRILGRQSPEGWYDEYGGADPGYQTHGSFYLARLWQMTGDGELAASLEHSMTFLAHFIHPDGSVGGEYASRNTQTYYPAAFEILAAHVPEAAWIARTMRASVLGAAAAGLRSVDAYNYFPVLNNLAFMYREVGSGAGTAEPREPSCNQPLVWFPEAGIARIRRESYDAWVGTAKGGVIKVWDRRSHRLVLSDCGWIGRTFDGRIASTQYQDRDRPADVTAAAIEIEGRLVQFRRPVMSPLRFMAFRLFSLTVGRWAAAGRWLKNQLVRVLIYRRKTLEVSFRRSISFGDTAITIVDELKGDHEGRLDTLRRGAIFTTIHMGSARYFVLNELDSIPEAPAGAAPDDTWSIAPSDLGAGVRVERTLHVS